MKPKFRLALGQINSTVGDFRGNAGKIIGVIRSARGREPTWWRFPSWPSPAIPPRTSF